MSPHALLQRALQSHAAGDLAQAESLYRQFLASDRDHPDALHNLGLLLLQRNDPTGALPHLRRAAQRAPHAPAFHLNLAHAYAATSQPDLAASAYQRFADLQPTNAPAAIQAATALGQLGRLDPAASLLRRALTIHPNSLDAHATLGVVLAKQGDHRAAVDSFRQALTLSPNPHPHLLINLALSLKSLGQLDDALATYDRALSLAPDLPQAHEYRGLTLASLNRHTDAICAYRESLRLHPDNPTAWNNLGASLQKLGDDPASTLDAFSRAISLLPTYAEAHNNLATALIDAGRPAAESLPHYDRAIELAPDRPDFRLNRALAYLAAGDYARGWPEHESRLRCPNYASLAPTLRSLPTWDGQPAPDKTLLIHAEQGFGDAIQFARFLPLTAQRVGRLIIQCHPPLARLFRSTFPHATILPSTDPLPPFDLHLPLLSLPAVLNTTLDTLPTAVPYLTPSPDLVNSWRDLVHPSSFIPHPSLRVALVWSGSATDPHRALRLPQLAPLASLPSTTFYSLQLGPPSADLSAAPFPIRDLSPHLTDFADTAAAIANMDLVITIDTATAHLAGALAKPTHTLLRFAPDWRWALSPDTTPWYPTIKLHRQPTPGDWPGAVARLVTELSALDVGPLKPDVRH